MGGDIAANLSRRSRRCAGVLGSIVALWAPATSSEAGAQPAIRNGRIAFAASASSVAGSVDTNVFTVLPDGSGLQQVTSGPEYDGHADWSPDGEMIAFWRHIGGATRAGAEELFARTPPDIWVVSDDGAQNLTNTPEIVEYAPDWSPDGTEIVFIADAEGPLHGHELLVERDLYIMDSDGSNKRRIAEEAQYIQEVSWSPEGTWIAYTEGKKIRLVSPHGNRHRTLGVRGRYPDWSPDGGRLAYSDAGAIWVVDVSKNRPPRALTARGPTAFDFGPAWSPDGKKIVFISDREAEGEYELFTMDADGTNIVKVVDLVLGSSQVTPPSWAPR